MHHHQHQHQQQLAAHKGARTYPQQQPVLFKALAPSAPPPEYETAAAVGCCGAGNVHDDHNRCGHQMPLRSSSDPRTPPPYWRRLSHVYDVIDPKTGHGCLSKTALVALILAVLSMPLAVACVARTPGHCPHYTAVWAGVLQLVNAALGLVAAKTGVVNFTVAHLVSAVLALVAAVIQTVFSVLNWVATEDFCYLKVFSEPRYNSIWFNPERRQEQPECNYRVKLGITFNTLLAVGSSIQCLLCIISIILCCRILCHCDRWRRGR